MAVNERVAVLLDGGWLINVLHSHLSSQPSDEQVYEFALGCVKPGELLFRIYYYDCYPFDGSDQHPITNQQIDFKQSALYGARMSFLDKLSMRDYMAFRHGRLQHTHGNFKLRENVFKSICAASAQSTPLPVLQKNDVVPVFTQKAVDMKIGLDIAWLSLKKIVDRIILVTNDTDFVPAIKFARREAIAIAIIDFGNVHKVLKGHADEIRKPDLSKVII